jgi:hypothetical protein
MIDPATSVEGGERTLNQEEECPFEDELEDDSALTVSDLVAAIYAAATGSVIDLSLAIAPEGHVELAEDADVGGAQLRDGAETSLEEILREVEISGRGKRRRIS